MDTKSLMVALRPEINAALAEIAKKHGLKSLELTRGTFSREGNFRWNLEGVCAGGVDKDAERYKQSMFLGLPELGTEFKAGTHSYKTVGINHTGTKIISARQPDGKQFLIPTDVVKRACGIKVEA